MDKETERIDYDLLEAIAEREKPKLIIGGGSAYPRILDFARMRQIADKVGAVLLIDMAHFAGLVAGGAHPSPVPHAQIVTTTTHKTLRGPRAGMILCQQQFAAAVDQKRLPRPAGWPADPRDRRQGRGLSRGAGARDSSNMRSKLCVNAQVLAETLIERRLPRDLRRHRHAPDAG